MVSERELERRLINAIKQVNGLCWKFISPGTLGVPDRICILPTGEIVFVELKTQSGISSKMQKYRHEQLKRCGVDVRVIKGDEELNKLIDGLRGYTNAI